MRLGPVNSNLVYVSNYVFAAAIFGSKLPWLYLLSPCAVYCISHGSCRLILYLGRGGPQDQDARVRHAHCVCRSHSQKYRYTKNRPIGVTVVFSNGTTHPARVTHACVLILWPSPFQVERLAIRSVGDTVYGARCLIILQGESKNGTG